MPEVVAAPKWLLLVHQLPSRPSNLRVHVWRRLQQMGAVALRNSLYVLPNTAESHEDFAWMRTEIVSRGGQVSVFAAEAVDGYTDEELEGSFRAARDAEYGRLVRDADALGKRIPARASRTAREALQREIARIRARFEAIKGADFFSASQAATAQAAVERLERAFEQPPPAQPSDAPLERGPFRRRVWVTRPRPGIDRMASAWLIRRFIAPDATFAFAEKPRRDQIPFDMPEVEFGHQGSDCTYETLVRRFAIPDTAAERVGHLVHDLDLKETRYGVPDTPTIGRLVDGIRLCAGTDQEMLDLGMRMIEALYRSFAADGQPLSRASAPRKHGARTRPPRRRS